MLNLVNLLFTYKDYAHNLTHFVVNIVLLVLMLLAAATAIVLILLQPSNSSGIDALGGSSETFFGKNKGKSIEEKMKRWTWICLAVLVGLAILFFILQFKAIWA